ncbi:MAG: hypothetical protein K0R31_1001 [Clostridiales bacterium]|nr:hypothetical protein [Clostridiales bacterium]
MSLRYCGLMRLIPMNRLDDAPFIDPTSPYVGLNGYKEFASLLQNVLNSFKSNIAHIVIKGNKTSFFLTVVLSAMHYCLIRRNHRPFARHK